MNSRISKLIFRSLLLFGSLLAIPNIYATEKVEENKPVDIIMYLGHTEVLMGEEVIQMPKPPTLIEGTTYLPLRFIGENILGAYVEWNSETREIRVNHEIKEVILSLDKPIAKINGEEVMLEKMPFEKQGVTLLPLRFMIEAFDLNITYDAETKQVRIQKSSNEEIQPQPDNNIPVAFFTFTEPEFIAGQTVDIIDQSFDEDEDAIVSALWKINQNEKLTHTDLGKIFKRPGAGIYDVSLQVTDERGGVSEWFTQTIEILPNQKPQIITLEPKKRSYAQGESLEFDVEVTNEMWEEITEEKWSYRASFEAANQKIYEKPKAIYVEGSYIITLQVKDAYGNWSEPFETEVYINDEKLSTEFKDKFIPSAIGATINNFERTNYQSYKEVPFTVEDYYKGTLIMSNSPEVVREKGLLYQDLSIGTGRLMFHHINNFEKIDNETHPKRLIVLAKNLSDTYVTGTISNQVVKGPSEDVLFVGAQLLYSYFEGAPAKAHTLEPLEQKVIYDSRDKKWHTGMAISGMFDFNFNGPIQWSVVVVEEDEELQDLTLLPMPSKDAHPRGTFNTMGQKIEVIASVEEPSKLVIGKDQSEWLLGYDALTGEAVTNRGNFGMHYEIQITAQDEDIAVILNPRGNMFKGAIKWEDSSSYLAPYKGYFPSSNRAVFIGLVQKGETKTLHYMLPNGSSAPVLFGMIPESQWE